MQQIPMVSCFEDQLSHPLLPMVPCFEGFEGFEDQLSHPFFLLVGGDPSP